MTALEHGEFPRTGATRAPHRSMPETAHGTSGGYCNWGCRCALCTAANTARMREYRRNRTAENTSGAGDNLEATTQSAPASAATDPEHGNQEDGPGLQYQEYSASTGRNTSPDGGCV